MIHHFKENKIADNPRNIGVVTPYAAQAKLHRDVLRSLNVEVDAGTVHRYQGDEKKVIVFDLPDSYGEHYVGQFLQQSDINTDGAKLLNVSLSRAEEKIVFICNLDALEKKLPDYALLRSVLFEAQSKGEVIPVQEILNLYPIEKEILKLGFNVELSDESLSSGFFSGADFEQAFKTQLVNAKESVVIYSGFITPNKISEYGELFRAALARGVRIRCVVPPPDRNGSMSVEQGEEAIVSLNALGVFVNMHQSIHQKIAVIDGKSLWVGSLNPLSFNGKTQEEMTLIESPDVASQVLKFLSIQTQGRDKDADYTSSENPVCPDCNTWKTVFAKGRYGPYFYCDSCAWK